VSLGSQRAILLRGDPGLFDILKRVGRTALGVLAGGPVGAVQTLARPFHPRGVSLPPVGEVRGPGRIQIPVPGLIGAGQRFVPGGQTGFVEAGCPKGFHLNKAAYMTMAGAVAARSKCVRNRRRNLSNGSANTRALRRMAAWEKQDKKRRVTLKAIARSAG